MVNTQHAATSHRITHVAVIDGDAVGHSVEWEVMALPLEHIVSLGDLRLVERVLPVLNHP